MASIDERVVSMAFENAKFETNANQTLNTLKKLNEALKLTGAAKGLQDVQAAVEKIDLSKVQAQASKISFNPLTSGIDAIKGKFSSFTSSVQSGLSGIAEKLKFPGISSVFGAISSAASKVSFSGITSAIANLKSKLTFPEAPKAFAEVENASRGVNFFGLTSAINSAAGSFSILSGAAAVALGNIVSRAVAAGGNIVKALSIDPVTAGFHNYETQINAVQTILANTGLTGAQGLGKVSDALNNLNQYANLTVFNFADMAKNIGTFTAAGVGLNKATESIKGIANLAALSGSSTQQASMAMYQLSQAIAAGTVHLQDWNSVVNAGLGGQVFQKALFNTGKAMGTLVGVPVGETFEEWKKKGNSFRQSLSTTAKSATDGTDQLKKAQSDAARSVADAQKNAADAIVNAQQRVKDAQQASADSARQSAEDIKNAEQAQADTIRQSAQDVASALDGVREARKRLAEAMKPPSKDELQAAADNLKTAQLDQQDLAGAVTDAQREQTRATEDLAAAQQNLADLQSSGKAKPSEILAAQRAVEDAQKRVTDAADAQTRALLAQRAAARGVDEAAKQLQDTKEKGTKKDKNVQSAQDALTKALNAYKDAQVKGQQAIADAAVRVADARRKSVENQIKSGQNLANAEKQQAKTIEDSQQSIADAHAHAAEMINQAKASISTTAPKSWLTSDVLTNTLQQFTGDMTTAQLKAKGFTDEQIKSIQQLAKTAVDSATKIRTMSQLYQALKEEVASAWGTIFKTLFGDINGATTLFTSLHTTIQNALTKPIYAFNKVLQGWVKMGGKDTFFKGLKQAMIDLDAIWKPIKAAFRDVFPPTTAKSLKDTTDSFARLMDKLKIGPETAKNLHDTFKGLFALLDIGLQVIKGVGIAIGQMLGEAGKGSGGLLKFTGGIGDFIFHLDKAIKKSDAFFNFFRSVGKILAIPIKLIGILTGLLGSLFGNSSSADTKGLSDAFGGLNDALTPMQKTLAVVSKLWEGFLDVIHRVGAAIDKVLPGMLDAFKNVVDGIKNFFSNINWDDVLNGIQTGLIAGIFVVLKKAFAGGLKIDPTRGVMDKVKGMIQGVTDSLKSMQQAIQATAILEIAVAIGVLAAGVALMATIDPKRLASAMAAVAVGLSELAAAMAVLTKIGGAGGFTQMPFIAGSLILLAGAMVILAGAMKIFATMSWDEIIRGLAGVGGSLAAVAGGLRLMPPNMALTAASLLPLAAAIVILGAGVKIFAGMKWEELGKGLFGLAESLGILVVAVNALPTEGMIVAGLGMVALGAGLIIVAGAVRAFGGMDLKTMAKGLAGIAASILVLSVAIVDFPPTAPLVGAGLILLGIGLSSIATAIALMGGLKISTIAKGLIGLGAALGIFALGLTEMAGTLPGSAALLLAAGGLDLLVPALAAMGTMKWGTILKGLAGIALSLGVLGAAGLVAGPGLVSIGAGLTFLGLGLAAIGAAVYLTAKGISLLSDEGQKGMTAVLLAITALVAALPKLVINFVDGLVTIVGHIAELAPKITLALGTIIDQLLVLIVQEAPKLAVAMGSLIDALILVILNKAPAFGEAAVTLFASFIQSISDHLPDILSSAEQILVTFLDHIAGAAPRLIASGVGLLLAFLGGIAQQLPTVAKSVALVVGKFLDAITSYLGRITAKGVAVILAFLNGIISKIPDVISAAVHMVTQIVNGIADNIGKVERSAVHLISKFLDAMADAVITLSDKIGKTVVRIINGIDRAVNDNETAIIDAGENLALDIVKGFVIGIADLPGAAWNKIKDGVDGFIHKVKDKFKIHSPSKVFETIGFNITEGLVKGIGHGNVPLRKAGAHMADVIVRSAADQKISEQLAGLFDANLNPVITPVVDDTNIKQLNDDLAKIAWFKALKATGKGFGGIDVTIGALQAEIDRLQNPSDSSSSSTGGVGGGVAPIQYVQNNYSPKTLTPTEVYRQTNNQLAPLRRQLGVSPG